MLVSSASSLSFKGNIIDSHGHLGKMPGEGEVNCTPSKLLETIGDSFEVTINGKKDKDEVTHVFVSNLNCISGETKEDTDKCIFKKNEIDGNNEILELCKDNKKLKPLAVCQPGHGKAENIEKLLKEHKGEFYGLKFHPANMKNRADDISYDEYMQLAKKYKKPCVFHSGTDGYSNPEHIIKLAERHSDVPVVLYHIDINKDKSVALDKIKESLDNKRANLFVDLSWLHQDKDKHIAAEAIEKLGADRVLFGTDAPLGNNKENERKNYIKYVETIKNDIHEKFKDKNPEKIIDKVFYENSAELFFIKSDSKVKKSKNKAWAIFAGAVAIGGAVTFALLKHGKQNQQDSQNKVNSGNHKMYA